MKVEDPIFGIWIIDPQAPYISSLLGSLAKEGREFSFTQSLQEAHDFLLGKQMEGGQLEKPQKVSGLFSGLSKWSKYDGSFSSVFKGDSQYSEEDKIDYQEHASSGNSLIPVERAVMDGEMRSTTETIMAVEALIEHLKKENPLPFIRKILDEDEHEYQARIDEVFTEWRGRYIQKAMEKSQAIGVPFSNQRAVRESERILWEHAVKTCVNTKKPGVKTVKTKVYVRIRKCAQAGMYEEMYLEFMCKDMQEAKEMAHKEVWKIFGENNLLLKGFTRKGKDFETELQNIRQHKKNALTFEVDELGRSTNIVWFPGNHGLLCFKAVDNTQESTISLVLKFSYTLYNQAIVSLSKEDKDGKDNDDKEEAEATVMMAWTKGAEQYTKTPVMTAMPLHPLSCVGIDTDAGRSISTKISDFPYLDTSDAAKESVGIRGIGGGNTKIGGRGPMTIKTKDIEGNYVLLVDPEGVYLEVGNDEPDFRVLGQQIMKKLGVRLVQCWDYGDVDVLECMSSKTIVPLRTLNSILVLDTYDRENLQVKDVKSISKCTSSALQPIVNNESAIASMMADGDQ